MGEFADDCARCFRRPITPCLTLMSVAGESRESDESKGASESGGERRAAEFVSVKRSSKFVINAVVYFGKNGLTSPSQVS